MNKNLYYLHIFVGMNLHINIIKYIISNINKQCRIIYNIQSIKSLVSKFNINFYNNDLNLLSEL